MSDGRIIELDAEWDLLESPEPPRERVRAGLRALAASVVAALCLATLGAGARAPVPPLSLLGLVKRPSSGTPQQMTDVRLAGGMLVAHANGVLIAMDPAGQQRWTARFDIGQDSFLSYWTWRENLIVEQMEMIRDRGGAFSGKSDTTSIALDLLTGTERWRVDGSVQAAGDVIIVGDGVKPWRIYRSLPSDLLWTMPTTLAWQVSVANQAIYGVTADGMFTEYDLHTGAVRASGKVEVPARVDGQTSPVGGYSDAWSLAVFRDRIVLRDQRFGEFGLTAVHTLVYDRTTLAPIPAARDQFDGLMECGPVLCAVAGEQVSIVDKDEFVELWRPPPGEYPFWTGSALMISAGSSIEASRIVDARTGRVLLRLDGWIPVSGVEMPSAESALWLAQFVPPHYTRIAVLRRDGLRIIGSVPFEISNCQLEGDLLACGVADGRVGVWRINLS